MFLPKITKKQNQIILLLYKFRFLTIKQIQKILSHKDAKNIKKWLRDLREKKYITLAQIVNPNDVTKPYIFCLDTKSKLIIKNLEKINESFLDRLHKEKTLTEDFIYHRLFIVDFYIHFLEKKPDNTV